MQMDIELLYAQVIAEARIYAQMCRDEKGGGINCGNEDFRRLGRSRSTYNTCHCFSPPKTRRSWKNYLLSWKSNRGKRSSDISNPNSNFKHRHSKVSHSAPLATTKVEGEEINEIFISTSNGFSWWRKRGVGGSYVAGVRSPLSPIAITAKAKVGCGGAFHLDSDFPYARLTSHSTSRFSVGC